MSTGDSLEGDTPASPVDSAGGEADPAAEHDRGIEIDVSAALHTAGHEIEDLGFEGVPDSAPVLHDDDEDEVDFGHRAETDIATRGQGLH